MCCSYLLIQAPAASSAEVKAGPDSDASQPACTRVTKNDERLPVECLKVEYHWTIAERENVVTCIKIHTRGSFQTTTFSAVKVPSSKVIPGSHFGNFKKGKRNSGDFVFPSSACKVWFRKTKEKKIYKSSTCHTKRCIYKIFSIVIFFLCICSFSLRKLLW